MKKELKEGTKEEKKTGKIPELYLDIQRRRTADERRVLAEAELCLLTHIEYQKAVAEWNRYVTEVTPWAALFQKLAGPLMIFAAAAREGQEQAARYAGQIQQAEERLRQILKTQLPGKQDASLPEVKRELETAEEFHLSQLTRPELSFEELEILVSLAERGGRTRGKQEELHQMISRQRQEQKQNLLYLREKREFFRSTSEHLNRKRKDRESHLVFMEAARQIIPAVQKMEQMNGGDLENARILGEQLLDMWKNQKGNRLCLLFYDDQEIPDAVRDEFRKAGTYEPACPGLYWREDRAEKTVYERILTGCFRENGREGTQSTDGKFI